MKNGVKIYILIWKNGIKKSFKNKILTKPSDSIYCSRIYNSGRKQYFLNGRFMSSAKFKQFINDKNTYSKV